MIAIDGRIHGWGQEIPPPIGGGVSHRREADFHCMNVGFQAVPLVWSGDGFPGNCLVLFIAIESTVLSALIALEKSLDPRFYCGVHRIVMEPSWNGAQGKSRIALDTIWAPKRLLF